MIGISEFYDGVLASDSVDGYNILRKRVVSERCFILCVRRFIDDFILTDITERKFSVRNIYGLISENCRNHNRAVLVT